MGFIKNKKLICFLILLFFCFLVLSANICWAANDCVNRPDVKGIWDKIEMCQKCGDCQLNDFIQLAVNASQWILGIVGSLTLLMFIYGGLMFIISSGSSEKVTKAKEIIIGAVIGLAIVFTAYIIIGFVFSAFDVPGKESWASSNWFKK
ncbi:MAG: pilin [Patescibacteria group bacterium]|nr:pilin [Patescibacteria group bacterium]MDD5294497.1 pilin [Patescibacteria group bacterium]MDD5554008.1 pilin [Patescibacteria group bacterium]